MAGIVINPALCTGCGACAADCVSGHIAVEGGAARVLPNGCIECGHCYAICPAGAVSMPGYETEGLENTASMSEFDPDRLLLAMQSRRSIRQFTGEAVSESDLRRIIEAGRFCPTGSNRQGVHFTVLRERLAEAEAEALRVFARVEKLAKLLRRMPMQLGLDEHFFFKGAPLAIVCSARSEVDAALAAAYMELMAESLGLGVLYSGFFVYAAKHSEKLAALLDLPAKCAPTVTLVIGHTDVSYPRRVPRRPANVNMQ